MFFVQYPALQIRTLKNFSVLHIYILYGVENLVEGSCYGLTPNRVLHSCLLTLLWWDTGNNRKGKSERTHKLRYHQFNSESKANQRIYSPLPMSRQVSSHLQEIQAPSCIIVNLEDKQNHFEHPPSSFFPPLCILSMTPHSMGYPFGHWGQLPQLHLLITYCALLAGGMV